MSLILLDDAQAVDTSAAQGIPIAFEPLTTAQPSADAPIDLGFQLGASSTSIDGGIVAPQVAPSGAAAQTGTAAGFGPLIVVALFALWVWKAR